MLALAIKLNVDKYGAIGRLACFWTWCLDYAPNGDLRKYDSNTISLACSTPLDALKECKWVDESPYLRVHDWWDFAGRYLQIKYKNYPQKWRRIMREYKGSSKQTPSNSPKGPNLSDLSNQPTKHPSFIPPTLEAVTAFALKQGWPDFEASQFWNHHESSGWLIKGRLMRSWEAAARYWRGNQKKFAGGNYAAQSERARRDQGPPALAGKYADIEKRGAPKLE